MHVLNVTLGIALPGYGAEVGGLYGALAGALERCQWKGMPAVRSHRQELGQAQQAGLG